MARTKLSASKRSLFQTTLDVRVEHINYGQHMGNDKFLSFAHQARVEFLKQHQASELDFFGAGLIMVDSVVNYRAEVFLGDLLEIDLDITDIQDNGFDFLYHFKTTQNSQQKTAALIKTTMCFFDYEKRKMTPTPKEFALQFQEGPCS